MLITALGIRGVGQAVAFDLAQQFMDLDALAQVPMEGLQDIEGIGPNIAQAIVDWFARPANQEVLRKLRSAGVWPSAEPRLGAPTLQPLAGLTFVVTGTLANFTRIEIKAFIQDHGGKVVGSVSRNTSFVIAGENAGSKLAKAQDIGVSVISESELRKMAEEM